MVRDSKQPIPKIRAMFILLVAAPNKKPMGVNIATLRRS